MLFVRFIHISIHAPARGATKQSEGTPAYFRISIHAPARGATRSTGRMSEQMFPFQSTLPRGERQSVFVWLPHSVFYFNPRSREGSDCVTQFIFTIQATFQSTLPRGERLNSAIQFSCSFSFQSTLPRGERLLSFPLLLIERYNFNPRSREGSDIKKKNIGFFDFNFNPRSREGSDCEVCSGDCYHYRISIHAPARGATSCGFLVFTIFSISIHAPARGATGGV